MSNNGWTVSDDVAGEYLNTCKLAVEDDEVFSKFKTIQSYKNILEHVTYREGFEYLNMITQLSPEGLSEYIEKFKENDTVGSPETFEFGGVVKNISPTTLRYIKDSFLISSLVGDEEITSIVEIGGGYGGLCKTISCVCDFDKYTLIDLPEVVALQEKYLSNFSELNNKLKFVPTNKIRAIKNVDLFISNYALSECDFDTQIKYFEKIICNAKFAHIIYNIVDFNDFYYKKFIERMEEVFDITTTTDFQNTVILAKRK